MNNRLLANIAMMLNDMKDNKVQQSLLQETIKIRELLESSHKLEAKTEATGIEPGEEPNNDETKDQDRQLLAKAIAFELSHLLDQGGLSMPGGLGDLGGGGNKAGAAAELEKGRSEEHTSELQSH